MATEDESQAGRLDRSMAEHQYDGGGLTPVQRMQLDRLLQEAGDDPRIRAAIAAMFYISLHQDGTVEQHIIAHREALRDDMESMMSVMRANADHQIATLRDVILRLDSADATRKTKFRNLEESQVKLSADMHDQRVTLRAQAWMIWALAAVVLLGGIIFLALLITAA